MQRRSFLAVTLAAGGSSAVIAQVAADYPNKPIRMIIGFPPGGVNDLVGRMMADGLSRSMGQPVYVENKGGASGMIGLEQLARSTADGYAIGVVGVQTHAINPAVYERMPYDHIRDFSPIMAFGSLPNVLIVSNDTPVSNLAELINYSTVKGELNFASGGTGTSSHLAGEMLKTATGLRMQHIAYKGSGPAVNDFLGGQFPVMFDNLPTLLQLIRSGKVRPIGVTSAKRSALLPNLPTLAEQGVVGFEATSWLGFAAPANTPASVVARLNRAMNAVVSDKAIRERMLGMGIEPAGGSSEEFGAHIRTETVKWSRAARDANLERQ